jgi:hypothetical protein
MKKTKPEYQDAKLTEFRTRLRSIPVKNLKKLIKAYQDEIERLLGYCLVLQEEVEAREKGKLKHG